MWRARPANRYQFSVAKCEVISASDVEFKIDQQVLPRTNCFKYLGVWNIQQRELIIKLSWTVDAKTQLWRQTA